MYCIINRYNGDIAVSSLTLKEARKWIDEQSEILDWDAEEIYMIVKDK